MTTVVVYPDAATIFAAACACIFVVVGVLGKLLFILFFMLYKDMPGWPTRRVLENHLLCYLNISKNFKSARKII